MQNYCFVCVCVCVCVNTASVLLREEHPVKSFWNQVLMLIFELGKQDTSCRKCIKKFHTWYRLLYVVMSRKMRWV
jgi:hypothetical protein